MRDLRERFEALDLLEAPYQWTDIERRAARPEVARTPSWLHGVWIAATTAAAVLVFVGGVVAGRWLLGPGSVLDLAFGGSGLFRALTPADVGVLALVVAGASGGSVLLATTLTLAWRWRKRNGRAAKLNERGDLMETMEKTIHKPERTIETVTRNNRWLILAVVVLLAVIVAAGAWLLIDNFVTSDVEALIEESAAAWTSFDFEAWSATVTDDFTQFDANADSTYPMNAMESRMSSFKSWGFTVENLGPMTVNGNWVSVPQRVDFTAAGTTYEGISVYEIEGDLIKQHFVLISRVP
jgi:hypothetical protein